MRHFPFVSNLVLFALSMVGAVAGVGTTARAQDYPWCANYTKGCISCSFVTRDQCMADVSGIGGFCESNPQYHLAATPMHQKSRTSSRLSSR
jgi:hypothetical protein